MYLLGVCVREFPNALPDNLSTGVEYPGTQGLWAGSIGLGEGIGERDAKSKPKYQHLNAEPEQKYDP